MAEGMNNSEQSETNDLLQYQQFIDQYRDGKKTKPGALNSKTISWKGPALFVGCFMNQNPNITYLKVQAALTIIEIHQLKQRQL